MSLEAKIAEILYTYDISRPNGRDSLASAHAKQTILAAFSEAMDYVIGNNIDIIELMRVPDYHGKQTMIRQAEISNKLRIDQRTRKSEILKGGAE